MQNARLDPLISTNLFTNLFTNVKAGYDVGSNGAGSDSGGNPALSNDVYNPDIVANRTIESREQYGFQETGDYVGSFKRPEVSDSKLKNFVDGMYKGDLRTDYEGTGSTADVARWEFKTGEFLNGTKHLTNKAPELINGLTKWINKVD